MKLLERHIETRGERRVERALPDVRVSIRQRGEHVRQRRLTGSRDQLFDRAGAQVGIPLGELVLELWCAAHSSAGTGSMSRVLPRG